jgi:hypothetical protein
MIDKTELKELFRMAIMGRPDAAEKLADLLGDAINAQPEKAVIELPVVEAKKKATK